jgi:putative phage-type endonuclease
MLSLAQQGSSQPIQGSDEWLESRKKLITGSKPSSLAFEFKSEADWERLYSEWLGSAKPPPFSEEAIRRMNWGSEQEDVAAAVVQSQVSNCIFFEQPLIRHPLYNWTAASPDGFLIKFGADVHGNIDVNNVIQRFNVEIKCPLFELRNDREKLIKALRKKKTMQYYYVPQIHAEMTVSGVKQTLFCLWTPAISRIFLCEYDPSVYTKTMFMLKSFKDRCCSFTHMNSLVKACVRDWQKYAADKTRCRLWKEIIHDE